MKWIYLVIKVLIATTKVETALINKFGRCQCDKKKFAKLLKKVAKIVAKQKSQKIYIKHQIGSAKYLHETTFEMLKYQN